MPWLVIVTSALVGVVTQIVTIRYFQIVTPYTTISTLVLAALGGVAGGISALSHLIHLHPAVAMVVGAMVGSLLMLWFLCSNTQKV